MSTRARDEISVADIVPVVLLQVDRINGLLWRCTRSSREAQLESLGALVSGTRAHRQQ